LSSPGGYPNQELLIRECPVLKCYGDCTTGNEEAVMLKSAATIVLVHGAWADGSSWNKIIPLLLAKHMQVIAVQLPLTSVEDDLAATNHIIGDTEGPIVLVGHSWGGMAITQAGDDPKVMGLVYVSAFAPDVGETGSSLISAYPTPPALSTIVTDSAGFAYQTVDGMLKNIAPDLPVEEARTLAVTQRRLAATAFGQAVAVAAWKIRRCEPEMIALRHLRGPVSLTGGQSQASIFNDLRARGAHRCAPGPLAAGALEITRLLVYTAAGPSSIADPSGACARRAALVA
jgi:pimeloyl-ACP methyl ester carboxylesterase